MRRAHLLTGLFLTIYQGAFAADGLPDLSSALKTEPKDGRIVIHANHIIDQPTFLGATTTIFLADDANLNFGPLASLSSSDKTVLKMEGPGTLSNDSMVGLSPSNLVLTEGTLINRNHAILGEKASVFLIAGGTFMNGDINTNSSAVAGTDAALIEVCGGTIVNDNSLFGLQAKHVKIQNGTVINRNGSYFGTSVSNLEIRGGTFINDNAHLGHHTKENIIHLAIQGGTVINQNNACIGSHHTHVTLSNGIVINSKDSQILSANFDMKGGQLINDGTVVIDDPDNSTFTPGGVITGAGYFKSKNPLRPFTVRNENTVIPGTIVPSINPGIDPASSSFSPEVRLSEDIAKQADVTNFVAEVIDKNSYGQLETPAVQFIPGTITLEEGGTYEQAPDATLVINVVSEDSHGQIVASSAHVDGTLQIGALSDFDMEPGKPLTIISTSEGVTGTFSHIESINFPSLLPNLFYLSDSITVSFSPTLTSYVGGFPQTLFASVNHLNIRLNRQMQQLRGRFTQEEISPPAPVSLFRAHRTPPLAQLMADNNEPGVQPAPQENNAASEGALVTPHTPDRPWNLYLGPLGSLGNVDCLSHERGFNYWSAGALAGFDYAFSHVGLGFAAAYEKITADVHEGWGHFGIHQAQASVYATYAPKPLPELAINGIIGGGYEWYSIHRNTGTVSSHKTAKGSPRGAQFDALLGLEYLFAKEKFPWMPKRLEFLPMVSLQYIFVHVDKYKEHGADLFDMKIEEQKAKSLRSFLGGQVSYLWNWTNLDFAASIDGGWQREYLNKKTSVAFAPLRVAGPAGSLTVFGAGRNTVLAGADLLFTLYKRYQLEASYDYEWNSRFQDHFFYLGFNVRF